MSKFSKQVYAAAIRGRYNKAGRTQQCLEVRQDSTSNALTTVQKDSLVVERYNMKPKMLCGFGEPNFGKQYRQGNRIYDSNHVAMCLNASPVGNKGGGIRIYTL